MESPSLKELECWELDDIGMLLELLERYRLGSWEEDERMWLLDREKGF